MCIHHIIRLDKQKIELFHKYQNVNILIYIRR